MLLLVIISCQLLIKHLSKSWHCQIVKLLLIFIAIISNSGFLWKSLTMFITRVHSFLWTVEFRAKLWNLRLSHGIELSRGIRVSTAEFDGLSLKQFSFSETDLKVALLRRHQTNFPIYLFCFL